MYSKALWHTSKIKSEIRESESPPAGGMIPIRSKYSLISLGTERLVACGKVPESLHEAMQVPYMEGGFDFPVKYGYSLVAKVESVASELGQADVHLMHPHQDLAWVKRKDCFRIPRDVPARRAVLASNMETAVNAIWDAQIQTGERILVVGFGLIGSLIARLASAYPGVSLDVFEVSATRKKKGQSLGFNMLDDMPDSYYDLVFHCSASGEGLNQSQRACRRDARIVETSWYGNQLIPWEAGYDFHYKRLRLISSQVSRLPVHMTPAWDFSRRKELVLGLLTDPVWDDHLETVIPFDQAPEFFTKLREGQELPLSVVMQYS